MIHRFDHPVLKVIGIPRLGKIRIEKSAVQRIDSDIKVCIRCHENTKRIRVHLPHALKETETGLIGHLLVAKNQTDLLMMLGENFKSRLRG